MPIASALVLVRGRQNVAERLLDADVDHVVAVVGQDDVDQVLADVVDVALDRREHHGAFVDAFEAFHVRLEMGDRGLHGLGALQHEGQLHLARAEQLANHLHAAQQVDVDDVERRVLGERLVEVVLQALAVAIDDPQLEPLLDLGRPLLLGRRGLAVGKQIAMNAWSGS